MGVEWDQSPCWVHRITGSPMRTYPADFRSLATDQKQKTIFGTFPVFGLEKLLGFFQVSDLFRIEKVNVRGTTSGTVKNANNSILFLFFRLCRPYEKVTTPSKTTGKELRVDRSSETDPWVTYCLHHRSDVVIAQLHHPTICGLDWRGTSDC
jgi:hypothetical protein